MPRFLQPYHRTAPGARICLVGLILALAGGSSAARAGVHVSLSGWTSQQTTYLVKYASRSGRLKVGLGLGRYFQIGIHHRREVKTETGVLKIDQGLGLTQDNLITYRSMVSSLRTGLEMTIFLFHGKILSPYLLGGIDYLVVRKERFEGSVDVLDPEEKLSPGVGPTAGGGFLVRLNRQLSLRYSHIFSEGKSYDIATNELTPVWDSYSTIGLDYAL